MININNQINRNLEKTDTKEPLGLSNLGNTCYMNSCIQCLMATSLPDILLSSNSELSKDNKIILKKKSNRPLFYQFLSIAAEFNSGNKNIFVPDNFKQTFDEKSRNYGISKFGPHEQKDAHEFMQALLDILHEETKKTAIIKCKDNSLPKDSIYQKAAQAYSNFIQRD